MKGKCGTSMTTTHAGRNLTLNAIYAYLDTILNGHTWRNNLRMARNNAKKRWARENSEGFEKSHALTDINRKIIKKKMMTTKEAYQRNKITKPFGMFWVLCG